MVPGILVHQKVVNVLFVPPEAVAFQIGRNNQLTAARFRDGLCLEPLDARLGDVLAELREGASRGKPVSVGSSGSR